MDFGGDDLDQFFGEDACDEFVKGIEVNFGDADVEFLKKMDEQCKTQEGQEIFSAVLIENDDMLRAAVFGKQDSQFKVDAKRNAKETVALLLDCSLAGKLITNDESAIAEFIQKRFQHFGDAFQEEQILIVTKSLMNQHAKAQAEQKKKEGEDGQIDSK